MQHNQSHLIRKNIRSFLFLCFNCHTCLFSDSFLMLTVMSLSSLLNRGHIRVHERVCLVSEPARCRLLISRVDRVNQDGR